uniref:Uncharacterized protein n=1 Tax=viral metagenome TaxID=1070528 RepID=A0A6C0F7I6_9ZZZZ|tara:strand:- start:10205 stop:10789 length:585 start_codon:yes stop_codon:yes gene_type:complete
MSVFCSSSLQTQNDLLLNKLTEFYTNLEYLETMMRIINGETKISLRIVDWFVTNYAKKYYTVYNIPSLKGDISTRFKVYHDYKLKLKAYSKKRFDPFCRWERITIPFMEKHMETTIGQLNFFKWAIEYKVIDYIEENYQQIENDMNSRNTSSKKRDILENGENSKTRKKREELSVSAVKCIKKEKVKIVVKFDL